MNYEEGLWNTEMKVMRRLKRSTFFIKDGETLFFIQSWSWICLKNRVEFANISPLILGLDETVYNVLSIRLTPIVEANLT